MIISIAQGQPYLAIRLVTPGSDGLQLTDWKHVRLVIIAFPEPRCELPLSPQCFHGFWPGHDVDRWNKQFCLPEDKPALIYPAFDLNDQGEIVFRLDKHIEHYHGRYLGRIETVAGVPLAELDLDIGLQQWVADQVSIDSVRCGGAQ